MRPTIVTLNTASGQFTMYNASVKTVRWLLVVLEAELEGEYQYVGTD